MSEVKSNRAWRLECEELRSRLADKEILLAQAVEYGSGYKQAHDEAMDNYQMTLARLAEAEALLHSTRNMWAIVAQDARNTEIMDRGHSCMSRRQVQSAKDRALGEVARIDAYLARKP